MEDYCADRAICGEPKDILAVDILPLPQLIFRQVVDAAGAIYSNKRSSCSRISQPLELL